MKGSKLGLSHSSLQIIAMICMLCDHVCTVLMPEYRVLNCVGRLSFPIYCFLIVEGYFHTHDCVKYILRLGAFGVISEVFFNLAFGGSPYYIYQNVMWTLLIGLLCVYALDTIKEIDEISIFLKLFLICSVVMTGCTLGDYFKTDYSSKGVLQVLVFYIFYGKTWYNRVLQVFSLIYINGFLLGGRLVTIGSLTIHMQLLAVFSILFIWLYNGKKGITNKYYKFIPYLFYPLHLYVLYLIKYFN